jgi:hypothetical protein
LRQVWRPATEWGSSEAMNCTMNSGNFPVSHEAGYRWLIA